MGEGVKLVYLKLISIIEREWLYLADDVTSIIRLETIKVYLHVLMDVCIFLIFSEDSLQKIFYNSSHECSELHWMWDGQLWTSDFQTKFQMINKIFIESLLNFYNK